MQPGSWRGLNHWSPLLSLIAQPTHQPTYLPQNLLNRFSFNRPTTKFALCIEIYCNAHLSCQWNVQKLKQFKNNILAKKILPDLEPRRVLWQPVIIVKQINDSNDILFEVNCLNINSTLILLQPKRLWKVGAEKCLGKNSRNSIAGFAPLALTPSFHLVPLFTISTRSGKPLGMNNANVGIWHFKSPADIYIYTWKVE